MQTDEYKPSFQDAINVVRKRLERAKSFAGAYANRTHPQEAAFRDECKKDAAALQYALDTLIAVNGGEDYTEASDET